MSQPPSASSMKRYPSSGVSALVIGGGIAGLTFAIEAYRKGHDVRLLDKRPNFDDYGDVIAIQQSALHTPKNWPGFMERLQKISMTQKVRIHKSDGTLVGEFPLGNPAYPGLPTTRSEIHQLLYEYAVELAIPIEFNKTVASFYENDTVGGVVLEDGSKIEADVVVSADGVGSSASYLVLGHKDQPVSSGSAVYRITYPASIALENPVLADWFRKSGDGTEIFMCPDAYVVVGKTPNTVCWVMTRKDDGSATEDWDRLVSTDDALKLAEGWVPFLVEMIKTTPNRMCTNWKLMWRDPQSKWVSPQGRVVQIGDSAHSFLPTSGAGATMSMEDAYSVATCLQLAGRSNVPLALQVHNKLRFERATCAQRSGLKNRNLFTRTDWGAVAKDPQVIGKFSGDWLVRHDPEQYAFENYGKCANNILMGTPFENTNSVPGYKYKPWTASEFAETFERNEMGPDEGEWY